MSEDKYKLRKLFEPGFLGTLEVKNRLIMPAMGTRLANESGGVSQRQIDYYTERAKGGIGAIITEVTCVDHPLGVTGPTNLTIHSNAYIAGHNELVEAVQTWGARIICQLVHAGRQTRPASIGGAAPVAPSAIPCKLLNIVPKELEVHEIEDIINKFVEAANRAKIAGYDGIEVHGAHGYLIGGFMSASSNQRNDDYGGNLEKRMNFPLAIIRGIRKTVGSGYPILFRLSADEFVEDGLSLEESKDVAKMLEDAGVDALNVSAGTYDSLATCIEPMSYDEGWKVYLAETIKKSVHIPVIAVGVIRSPKTAERIIEEEKADFVALGRALLADPYWPKKAKEGREKEIIPCISCNDGCIGGRIFRDLHIRCALNPLTGRERFEENLVPVSKGKRVFVVGGGPAGMVAALTAKKRGHEVTLYERSSKLGGQLCLASAPPGKEKIKWYLDYLIREIERENIESKPGQPVNSETIIEGNPDAVIIATGATPVIPDIPGVAAKSVCTTWQLLGGENRIEDKVVFIIGGGSVGCETALYLVSKNKKVIISEMLSGLALDLEPINRMDLLSRMQIPEIQVLLNRKVEEIEKDCVVISDGENREEVKADVIVLAAGVERVNDLERDIKEKVDEIYVIGDCKKPRKIMDAVYEGFQAALRL